MPEIEELAVRLTAEGEGFLDEVEEKISDAEERLEEFGESFENIEERMAAVGELVRNVAVDMGTSLEEAASFAAGFGLTMGLSADQALAAAENLDEGVAKLVDLTMARFQQRLHELGVTLDQETVGAIRATLVAMAELSAGTEDAEDSMTGFADDLAQAAAETQRMNEQQEQATPLTDQFGQALASLASRAVGALSILTLINKAIGAFTNGIQVALEFSDVNFRLAAAINAQQQAQGRAAGTMAEWNETVQEITQQFSQPFERAVRGAAAAINLMSQNLNVTGDQMQQLLVRSAAVAELTGDELEPTVRRLVRFIDTGYREGLVDLGISMNDANVQQAAFNLGINKALNEMTEAELQAARYQAIIEQTEFSLEAAGARAETFAGRMDEVNKANERSAKIIGNVLLPLWVNFREVMASVGETAAQLFFILATGAVTISQMVVGSFQGLVAVVRELQKQLAEGIFDPQALADTFEGEFRQAFDRIDDHLRNLFGDPQVEDTFGQFADAAEEMSLRVSEAFDDASDAIEDAVERWEAGVERAQQRLADRLEDIDRDLRDRLFDLRIDLQRDLEDIDRDAAEDRLRTIRDAQVEEIRAREDHARAVRELEIRYLFDLEDAVRERDARQVLLLRRNFREQRRQLDEEFGLNDKRRKEDLALELADLERRRIIRRNERIIAAQEEAEDLRRQAERRRQDAERRYRRELRDLQTNINRRLRLVAQGIQNELNLTAQGLEALYKMLQNAFGSGGWVEAFYRNYSRLMSSPGVVVPGQGGLDAEKLARIGLRQRGGTVFATSPTLIGVGEGRPERLDVTPMSHGRPSAGFGGAGGGRAVIEVRVDASERLVVDVADFVENDIADVMVTMTQNQRAARGAFR